MLKRTRKTFIVSDLHFGHSNIIKYCNRPYKVEGANKNPANIPEVTAMNEDILAMFDRLPDECDIWNLGDVFFHWFFGNRGEEEQIIEKLRYLVDRMKGESGNRHLYVVLGNHDDYRLGYDSTVDLFYRLGFDRVYDSPVLIEDKYILSHEPVYLKVGSNLINLYGHTHDLDIDDTYFMYDYENYAMEKRVLDSHGVEVPPKTIRYPDRYIDLKNYKNMCLDKNHGILEWEGDYFKLATVFYRRGEI